MMIQIWKYSWRIEQWAKNYRKNSLKTHLSPGQGSIRNFLLYQLQITSKTSQKLLFSTSATPIIEKFVTSNYWHCLHPDNTSCGKKWFHIGGHIPAPCKGVLDFLNFLPPPNNHLKLVSDCTKLLCSNLVLIKLTWVVSCF